MHKVLEKIIGKDWRERKNDAKNAVKKAVLIAPIVASLMFLNLHNFARLYQYFNNLKYRTEQKEEFESEEPPVKYKTSPIKNERLDNNYKKELEALWSYYYGRC